MIELILQGELMVFDLKNRIFAADKAVAKSPNGLCRAVVLRRLYLGVGDSFTRLPGIQGKEVLL